MHPHSPSPLNSAPVHPILPSIPSDITVHTLPNGFQLILKEDPSSPVVSVQVWCRTGSIHEDRWLGSGISHLVEHMVFKGTQNYASSQIDLTVQDIGGQINAYTSFDRTVYYIDTPREGGLKALDILLELTLQARLPEAELAKEMDVIRREMDMGKDDPGSHSSRRFFEVAYSHSPYRFPIIGLPDVFNQLHHPDLLAYYQSRYIPNQQFLVVVGDFSSEEWIRAVETKLAAVQARSPSQPHFIEEPRPLSPKEIVEYDNVEHGHLHLAWHIPNVRHSDIPALDVLATVLGNGRSSRFYERIREPHPSAHSVDAWVYSPGKIGLFGASAVIEGDQLSEIKEAILKEIQLIRQGDLSQEEIHTAIRKFTVATLGPLKTAHGQASDLGGNWLISEDLNFSHRYLQQVQSLTPSDLVRVCQTYLTPETLVSYALIPKQFHVPNLNTTRQSTTKDPVLTSLPNGLRLLVKEDHRLPLVQTRLAFHGGVLRETPQNNGLTQLTSKLLIKGTQQRSASQLAQAIESLGASIQPFSGNNSFGLSAEFLKEDWSAGWSLFTDILLHASFPSDRFEREKALQIASIQARNDHLLSLAFLHLRNGLFGANGYGLDSLGNETLLNTFNASDCQNLYRQTAVPNNGVLAIYGPVDPAFLHDTIGQSFSNWTPGESYQPVSPSEHPLLHQRAHHSKDKKQSVLALGFVSSTLKHPDRFALECLAETCSDMGSRLFQRVREKLGLAYYVGAQCFCGLIPGYLGFYAGTSPEHAIRVEEEIWKEIHSLRNDPIQAEELQRIKNKILGHRKIGGQDLGGQAMSAALNELFGLGYHYHEQEDELFSNVTQEDILRVAQHYLTQEKSFTSWINHPDPLP